MFYEKFIILKYVRDIVSDVYRESERRVSRTECERRERRAEVTLQEMNSLLRVHFEIKKWHCRNCLGRAKNLSKFIFAHVARSIQWRVRDHLLRAKGGWNYNFYSVFFFLFHKNLIKRYFPLLRFVRPMMTK